MIAVGTVVAVLAIIGLVLGLVILGVVIYLLQGVLSPLLSVRRDLESANTAQMLTRGVPGTEQLTQTRQLAASVPDLALAYLQKLGAAPAPVTTSAPPPAAAPASDTGMAAVPAWMKRFPR